MSTAAEFAPTEGRCHCGHYRWHHYLRGCESLHDYRADGRRNKRTRGKPCPCPGFDDSVLPADGERLEFGRHRLSARVAESAPAWPGSRGGRPVDRHEIRHLEAALLAGDSSACDACGCRCTLDRP